MMISQIKALFSKIHTNSNTKYWRLSNLFVESLIARDYCLGGWRKRIDWSSWDGCKWEVLCIAAISASKQQQFDAYFLHAL